MFFLCFGFNFLIAQNSANPTKSKGKTIELIHANSLEFDKRLGIDAKRLIGNVQLKDGTVLMYCDSAYLYNNNSADAFGHIHITQNDTINVYGELLKYDGNKKLAELQKNVRLVDKDMILSTDILFFDLTTNTANYPNKGTIVSKENTLVSDHGYYFANSKELSFKKNVVLTNPKYVMNSDTLIYNTFSKTTRFIGPTTIKSNQEFIYCENGFYNTVTDIAQFNKNAYLITKSQKLKGDSLYYDKKNGIGKGFKNIQIIDSAQNITITGDYAYHNQFTNASVVTQRAVLSQIYGNDTLFLHADTLKAMYELQAIEVKNKKEKIIKYIPDTNKRLIKAYHHVRFFKADIQGKCDSLAYSFKDSIMCLFKEPVLWSDKNQLTADKVELKTGKGKLQKIYMEGAAFIISLDDSIYKRYNQIKGKVMHGYFVENKLRTIKIEGNGETIYFGKDKQKYIGVNKAECSDLLIVLKDNQIDKITFITKPEATLHPLNELTGQDLILKNFSWKLELRPKNKNDIF